MVKKKMRLVATRTAEETERAIDDLEKHGGTSTQFYVAGSGYEVTVLVRKPRK